MEWDAGVRASRENLSGLSVDSIFVYLLAWLAPAAPSVLRTSPPNPTMNSMYADSKYESSDLGETERGLGPVKEGFILSVKYSIRARICFKKFPGAGIIRAMKLKLALRASATRPAAKAGAFTSCWLSRS